MTALHQAEVPIVLVALDGSRAAVTAVPVARTLARQLGGALEALYVASSPTPVAELRERIGLTEYAVEDVGLHVEVGDAADAILQRVADPRVAVVVLTTHGREVESDGRLGHVAEAVIGHAEQPVLLVRPEIASGWDDAARTFDRLLLPLDGTPTTALALRPATRLCGRLGAALDVLYVAADDRDAPEEPGSIGAPQYLDQPQHEWPQWGDEVLDRLVALCADCPPEVNVHAYFGRGNAGDEIVRFALEHHLDAIVLARRSHLEPERAPTLRTVLRRAPCPILLVGVPEEALTAQPRAVAGSRVSAGARRT